MFRNVALALLFLSLFFINLNAQHNTVELRKPAYIPEEINKKCTEFFQLLMKSETENAMKKILKDSPMNSDNLQIENILESIKIVDSTYGKIKGFEPVGSENRSDAIVKAKYVGLHSDFPLTWIFVYYKSPEKGWILINMKLDNDIDNLFDKDS